MCSCQGRQLAPPTPPPRSWKNQAVLTLKNPVTAIAKTQVNTEYTLPHATVSCSFLCISLSPILLMHTLHSRVGPTFCGEEYKADPCKQVQSYSIKYKYSAWSIILVPALTILK